MEDLGTTWKDIHEKYLDTIGNMTLTAYNREMSNKSYSQKKETEQGFNKSKLFLNDYLHKTPIWNEEAIKRRATILKDQALKIWMYHCTEYVSSMNVFLDYILSDEHNFTGDKTDSFIFLEENEKQHLGESFMNS